MSIELSIESISFIQMLSKLFHYMIYNVLLVSSRHQIDAIVTPIGHATKTIVFTLNICWIGNLITLTYCFTTLSRHWKILVFLGFFNCGTIFLVKSFLVKSFDFKYSLLCGSSFICPPNVCSFCCISIYYRFTTLSSMLYYYLSSF